MGDTKINRKDIKKGDTIRATAKREEMNLRTVTYIASADGKGISTEGESVIDFDYTLVKRPLRPLPQKLGAYLKFPNHVPVIRSYSGWVFITHVGPGHPERFLTDDELRNWTSNADFKVLYEGRGDL